MLFTNPVITNYRNEELFFLNKIIWLLYFAEFRACARSHLCFYSRCLELLQKNFDQRSATGVSDFENTKYGVVRAMFQMKKYLILYTPCSISFSSLPDITFLGGIQGLDAAHG